MSQNNVSENITAFADELKKMLEQGRELELIERLTKEDKWRLMTARAMQSADARNNNVPSQRLIDFINAELERKSAEGAERNAKISLGISLGALIISIIGIFLKSC